jgi:PPOX class probable F420-dependent enzyme
MTTAIPALAPLVYQKTVVLTSFRRDGEGAPTAGNIAVGGDRAFANTYAAPGKHERIRRDPLVTVTPSDFRDRPAGPALPMRAHFVEGADYDLARRLIEGSTQSSRGYLSASGTSFAAGPTSWR